ncbi:glutaredoxin family protein [Desulfobacca acetoxidans]|uniref:Glutaredoxin n=1 Tax=Desulfobacca acetoxidans (strain ATCC 700848 / DSM 11109 / ASRB2) TaxID=880072 RepID=F2NC77_DESAR|nr:glutaredoxin family protein [Desulfobacca acetoxidans]AEB08872.1 glutaredoxin [Desulfobacca acetoxidans DSM 11109]HAY22127.1 glutaredoxin family protein [Desulfobacterales bacterium]
MQPSDIKLYALSTCSHCRNCKEFLAQCGFEYDCVDVDRLEPGERRQVLEEIKNINPNLSFPTLVIGDKVVIGFKKEEIQEILNSR